MPYLLSYATGTMLATAIIGSTVVQGDQVRGESTAEYTAAVEAASFTVTQSELVPGLLPIGFVLAARLEEVAFAASAQLQVMSRGRFRLRHDDSVARRN